MSLPKKTPEYSAFQEISPVDKIAYGPVQSLRLGNSLGINLLGKTKICSFDCPYCELGSTEFRMNQIKGYKEFPSLASIESEVRQALRDLNSKNEKIDWISISGNGEPTLYPQFEEAIDILVTIRSELAPKTKLGIFSNGAHFDTRKIINGVNKLDDRFIKLDAGSDKSIKVINSPLIRAPLQKVIAGARSLENCIVQSIFIKGSLDNTTDSHIEDWIEVVGMVKPKLVHLYTIQTIPFSPGLKKVDEDTLYTIASKLKRRTTIESAVFL